MPNALGTNWSGSYQYRARHIHCPRSVAEVQALVARQEPLRALGSRHAFTGIGDSRMLVSLDRLPRDIAVDPGGRTVSVAGHVTYAELAQALVRHGLALHNLASLPHISVAGAVATATHGSGDRSGNLATAVRHLQIVSGTGDLLDLHPGEARFGGAVVGLGALGIVTRLTLTVEPHYEMRQRVFEDVSWEVLLDRFDRITATGDSVSMFHRFGDRVEQVWVKQRLGRPSAVEELQDLLGAAPAATPRHPVPGADPANCTAQLGRVGPWSERLPHFRSGFTPSAGEEIQSELFVARGDAAAAIEALRPLAPMIAPLLFVSEVRTIAADSLWLSPQYERDAVAIHFTWCRRQREVEQAVQRIEAALAPFGARPHWGKLFTADAAQLAPLYPRLPDFLSLREQLDPHGVFVNDWLRRHVLGSPDAPAGQAWHTGGPRQGA